MPTRILRDWTDSEKVNSLSPEAERFFTRLIMKADDYGRYSADPRILTSTLFPLLIGKADCQTTDGWLAECRTAQLVQTYETGEGKKILQILNFQQRVRQDKSKWPDRDGHLTVNGQTLDGQPRPETYTGDGDGDEGGKNGSSVVSDRNGEWHPTDEQKRLNALFHRRDTTRWSPREIKAHRQITPIVEEDLKTVETFYAETERDPAKGYRRHDLQTLLNNFNAEVDRARNYKPRKPF